jgi:glycosyltransferase involved in cell wall biosynthesis
MKFLILAENYPDISGGYRQQYIHNRLISYNSQGISSDVISFDCVNRYYIDGIKVYPSRMGRELMEKNKYDAVISHAPNLRNHIRFLLLNFKLLPSKVFFIFHGHEILIKSDYYPEPYKFQKRFYYPIKKVIHDLYDFIKLKLLTVIIKKYLGNRLYIIFVSEYLKRLFLKGIEIDDALLEKNSLVINNGIHAYFLEQDYQIDGKHPYDFITIRNYDKSVYALDSIVRLALKNPKYNFHIYGIGSYFNYNKKPLNITLFQTFKNPSDIPELLSKYKAAVMLSRHDSQGVMACEAASFGMPIIVSDIPASREMLSYGGNVYFMKDENIDLKAVLETKILDNKKLKDKFSAENTSKQELKFIIDRL